MNDYKNETQWLDDESFWRGNELIMTERLISPSWRRVWRLSKRSLIINTIAWTILTILLTVVWRLLLQARPEHTTVINAVFIFECILMAFGLYLIPQNAKYRVVNRDVERALTERTGIDCTKRVNKTLYDGVLSYEWIDGSGAGRQIISRDGYIGVYTTFTLLTSSTDRRPQPGQSGGSRTRATASGGHS